jgi:hypothetical protein
MCSVFIVCDPIIQLTETQGQMEYTRASLTASQILLPANDTRRFLAAPYLKRRPDDRAIKGDTCNVPIDRNSARQRCAVPALRRDYFLFDTESLGPAQPLIWRLKPSGSLTWKLE